MPREPPPLREGADIEERLDEERSTLVERDVVRVLLGRLYSRCLLSDVDVRVDVLRCCCCVLLVFRTLPLFEEFLFCTVVVRLFSVEGLLVRTPDEVVLPVRPVLT